MNVPKSDDIDHESSAPKHGPGSLLKRTRERHGLEPAGAAARLHLQTATIYALEADDYESLPNPVFIQGYLRNYARLLGLDEDAVVSDYQRQLPQSEEQQIGLSKPQATVSSPISSSHGLMRLMTWSVVLVLSALLFFWWQNRADLAVPEPIPMTYEQQEEIAPDPAMPLQEGAILDRQVLAPDLQDIGEADSLVPESMPDEPEAVEQIDTIDDVGDPLEVEALDEMELIGTEPSPPSAFPQEEVQSIDVVQDEVDSQTQEAARPRMLLFKYSGPCWTEVRDRDGKARIIGEIQSGTQRRLSGQFGPFSIVLGDTSAVTLTIDDEPFDLTPFTRGRVAKFILDPEKL
jgi:cytoskeleton protein RodZ